MDVTKILAGVPIQKTNLENANAQKSASTTGTKPSSSAIQDSVDISSAAISGETLSANDAEGAAKEVGAYFTNNDDSIGADTNKLAQL
jgi:hypothetical protein